MKPEHTFSIIVQINGKPGDSKGIGKAADKFMSCVESLDYPKESIEVVFITESDKFSQRFLRSRPLIRIVDMKGGLGPAAGFVFSKCYGDILLFCDMNARPGFDLKNISEKMAKSNTAVVLGKGWYAARKVKVFFPSDLNDIKTYILIFALINKYRILGPWGVLNGQEVLRLLYKFNNIRFFDKVRLILSVRTK